MDGKEWAIPQKLLERPQLSYFLQLLWKSTPLFENSLIFLKIIPTPKNDSLFSF